MVSATPLLGLIPLLDTHQRWQPPTLRHPPPHQSVSTGRARSVADRLCNTSTPPGHYLPASCCQSVTRKGRVSHGYTTLCRHQCHMANHSPCCHVAGFFHTRVGVHCRQTQAFMLQFSAIHVGSWRGTFIKICVN